ncbi:MAG: autotransporter-associated beta strand repeat-containing protein, partial [Thermoguttaceae bacterium]|nr:autotransporter-associated beta strand repeat-containing protein [Thermoguttaceae bacterium]
NISGGTLSIPNTVTYLAWDGYAEMNISGGTVSLKGLSLSNSGNAKGTLTLTGGTLNMGEEGVSRNKRGAGSSLEPVIQFGNGTINATASHTWASNLNITLTDYATTTFNADAGKTITLASKIAGGGSIQKTGEGTLILSNANTYTGSTTVDGGTLKLTGNGTPGTGYYFTVNGTVEYAYSADKTLDYDIYGGGNLVKSGEYALTLPTNNYYSGKTTVSEGTLILPDSAYIASSEIEVQSGAYFKAGDSVGNASINVNGGNFVLGIDNSVPTNVCVSEVTVSNSGIISFNMNSYEDAINGSGSDSLTIYYSASMDSGYLNLVFSQDSNLWLENMPDEGYQLITYAAYSETPQFDFTNMGVLINGATTSKWKLNKTDTNVFLVKASGDDPTPVTPYWNANNGDDLAMGQWTIDHNPKLGVQFIEGTNDAAEYSGAVVMSENASYEVGNGKVLLMSGTISGSGAMEKIGAGTLYLSNANSYSGGTTISAGNVTISNPSALGTGSVTINGGALDATPAGKSQTFNNDVIVGDNGATVSVATGEYSNFKSISGSGDLTSNGYVHFNGTGGYNGHLTVNSGYTRVNPGAVGVIDLTINQGGHFNVYDSGTVQIGKLNSTADVEVFGSKNASYTYEIGVGTTSSDEASFAGHIRGYTDKYNLTIKKVGEGTQIFCRTGYGYAGTGNSIKEVIIDGGKMVINAKHDVFGASSTTGFWGSAPITINEGGTLEYSRSWTTSPNVQMTINGGTLTLTGSEYLNKLTFNSATVNGSGSLRAGYVGNGTWNVTGGVSTVNNTVYMVLKNSNKSLTINIDDGATLDLKKNLLGLDGYTGSTLTVNGGDNGTGLLKLHGFSGAAITGMGAMTFNNIKISVDGNAGWL